MPNYQKAISRKNWEKHGERASILDFGAKADLIFGADGIITAGSNTVQSPSSAFTSKIVGKSTWIESGIGPTTDLLTTITSILSPTSFTVSTPPTNSASGLNFRYFTDNTAVIQFACNIGTTSGFKIEIPRGAFGTIDPITVNNCLFIYGHGTTENNKPATASSQIVCCGNNPIFQFLGEPFPTNVIEVFNCEKLTLVGTSRNGSKGIYLNTTFGTLIKDVSFHYFGNHALHIETGESGLLDNLNAQDCWLARESLTDYVGVIECGASDVEYRGIVSTSSESYTPSFPQSDAYDTGFVAAIAIKGGNSFAIDCQAHGSEIGFFVGGPASNRAQSSASTITNCRADQNQGQALVVAGFNNHFLGFRAYTNCLDADGVHNCVDILDGGGNLFSLCQIIGPANNLNNRYKNIFESTTPNSNEANYFRFNYIAPGSFTGSDYIFSGTQTSQPVCEDIAFESSIGNVAAIRFRSDVIAKNRNIWVQNASLFIQDTEGLADSKLWAEHINIPSNENQLLRTIFSDNGAHETVYERITRSGMAVPLFEIVAAAIKIIGDLQINTGNIIKFLSNATTFSTGAGNPNGIVAAPVGSIHTDTNGLIWIKASDGNSNIGWLPALAFNLQSSPGQPLRWTGSQVATGAIDLHNTNDTEVTGILAIANGGTGGSDAASTRAALSVYSKAEVDSLLVGKANSGGSTGSAGTPAHTHTQI